VAGQNLWLYVAQINPIQYLQDVHMSGQLAEVGGLLQARKGIPMFSTCGLKMICWSELKYATPSLPMLLCMNSSPVHLCEGPVIRHTQHCVSLTGSQLIVKWLSSSFSAMAL
jgi:hypothetical protein